MARRLAKVVVLSYTALLGYVIMQFSQFVGARNVANASAAYPQLSEIRIPLGCGFVLVFVQKAFQVLCRPVATMVIQKKGKWSHVVYESKLERFGSAIFKFLFFSVFSWFSYVHLLRGAEWMPSELFGNGSTAKCWGDGRAFDNAPMELHLLKFYQVAIAYHTSELIFQILYEMQKPDFVEMWAHHATTCFLVLASYQLNCGRIGSLVLFLHYVSDVPVYGAKIFVDTKLVPLAVCNLVGMLVSWGYLRLYCLPRFIISSCYLETKWEQALITSTGSGVSGETTAYIFCGALGLLWCLHCYWYWCFIQMGYNFVAKGESKDLQANLTAMDLQKEAQRQKEAKRQ